MWEAFLAVCGSPPVLWWTQIVSDLAIALAYFSIPLILLWVVRNKREDIPYPWLWLLFVTFITACGITHALHAWSMLAVLPMQQEQALIAVITALVSVGTAIAFIWVLPQINLLPSPQRVRVALQNAVDQATLETNALLVEKDQLIQDKSSLLREVNHRVGNNLAIMGAVVRRELRDAKAAGLSLDGLLKIQEQIDQIGKEHHKMSASDYKLLDRAHNFILVTPDVDETDKAA